MFVGDRELLSYRVLMPHLDDLGVSRDHQVQLFVEVEGVDRKAVVMVLHQQWLGGSQVIKENLRWSKQVNLRSPQLARDKTDSQLCINSPQKLSIQIPVQHSSKKIEGRGGITLPMQFSALGHQCPCA